jgi:GT2 family glycosyltransferase
MTASPLLSICIVNWNTREDLARVLASISLGGVPDREVILVDNASTDGSPEMVKSRFPEVKLLQNEENVGFSRAYNRALGEATGRYLLVLNPDCVVHDGALAKLIEFMETHPEAGAVGPRLLNTDGSLQFSCRRFPTFAAGLFRNTPLGRIFPGNRYSRQYLMMEWDHSLPQEVDWISGAAMLIRRRTLEEVGLLDEGFYMYCEDVDWCYRARQKGWKIFYLPSAGITHVMGRASDQRPRAMVVEFHRSMRHFYRKHYAAQWPIGARWLPLLAIRLRLWTTLLHYHLLSGNKKSKA